mmetsp:Transcript_8746/g.17708  ORF Transcript_8746/g.17708 Transcript_8746/m.17708 type:complete len:260 (-) Transcript_8746:2739-3518(-)
MAGTTILTGKSAKHSTSQLTSVPSTTATGRTTARRSARIPDSLATPTPGKDGTRTSVWTTNSTTAGSSVEGAGEALPPMQTGFSRELIAMKNLTRQSAELTWMATLSTTVRNGLLRPAKSSMERPITQIRTQEYANLTMTGIPTTGASWMPIPLKSATPLMIVRMQDSLRGGRVLLKTFLRRAVTRSMIISTVINLGASMMIITAVNGGRTSSMNITTTQNGTLADTNGSEFAKYSAGKVANTTTKTISKRFVPQGAPP